MASVAAVGFLPPQILVKDVAIVGGGSSGAYAAVRLRDDYKKSVALIEKADHLVSHHHDSNPVC